MTYQVEISRTVTTTVTVDAADPEDAIRIVDAYAYPLPPPEDWEPVEGWGYVVLDQHGHELLRRD